MTTIYTWKIPQKLIQNLQTLTQNSPWKLQNLQTLDQLKKLGPLDLALLKDDDDLNQQSLAPNTLILTTNQALERAPHYLRRAARACLPQNIAPETLLAYIEACLDTQTKPQTKPQRFDIQSPNLQISLNGQPLKLSKNARKLLQLLLTQPEVILSRNSLYRQVFQQAWDPKNRRIDILISEIRKALNEDAHQPKHIHDIRKLGYYFKY